MKAYGQWVVLLVATACGLVAACGSANDSAVGQPNSGGSGAGAGVPAVGSGAGGALTARGGNGSGGAQAGTAPAGAGAGAAGSVEPGLSEPVISYWQFGTADKLEETTAVGLDASENVYVAGSSSPALCQAPSGDYKQFVRKFDVQGNVLWSVEWASERYSSGVALAVEAGGNFYVGYGDPDSVNEQTSVTHLEKYDPNGVLLWRQESTSLGIAAIGLDKSNNLYVAGSTLQMPRASTSAYVRKYDGSGVVQWTTPVAAPSHSYDVAVDAAGSSYVIGSTDGPFSFQLYKLDALGNLVWTKPGEPRENMWSVALEPSGDVYLASIIYGMPMGDVPDPDYALLRKYDAGGNTLWARELENPLRLPIVKGVRADLRGNAYLVGYSEGPVEGSAPNAAYTGFVRKYDTNGVVQWTEQSSIGDESLLVTLAVAASGNLYCAGIVRQPPVCQDSEDDNGLLMKLDVH
ncbi:MAG TPA: hypothetical protein VGJ91_10450 [Polyangiaceae bacterium]